MDADWGSSSDDEETAAKKVVARQIETEKVPFGEVGGGSWKAEKGEAAGGKPPRVFVCAVCNMSVLYS